MKTYKSYLYIFVAIVLLLGLMTGCGDKSEKTDTSGFSYSDDIDKNGFWEGITATDYVEKIDYNAFPIPSDVSEISDDVLQSNISEILKKYSTTEEIKDRAVKDGDTVNIDYVGSVDGVEFEGGNTNGAGTDVTIGVTSYIDNFLEQLIGHKPGETFNINVTFPEDYGQENLNGKAAVFKTTINYIVKTVEPKLNDAFVAKNLSEEYGWKTVSEMNAGNYDELQKVAIQNYINEYLANDATTKPVPDAIIEHQKDAMVKYYEVNAESSGVTLEEYLNSNFQISSVDEFIKSNAESTEQSARYTIAIQAIAEDAKISVSDEDVSQYFKEEVGADDYTPYEKEYGMPYLKQSVLAYKVLAYLTEHAVLE
jgi:trigger factor